MKLDVLQNRTLELYAEFHRAPPTVSSLWRKNVKPHLMLSLIAGCAAASSWFLLEMPAIIFLVIGLAAGSLLRDYGRIKQTVQSWPVLEQIIDWDQVNGLLNADAKSQLPD